ncbi:MAG: SDR family NAD(P)-dependent oxidoreductase, partial [Halieaceae bacterium]|nr:SDR family NAD(P)-dependent oxidoreductase [Halieaceae bacterium]
MSAPIQQQHDLTPIDKDNFFQCYGPAAVVTGASSGIGEAFAHILAAMNFDVFLVARRRDRLAALASELTSVHDVAAHICVADLGTAGGLEDLLKICRGKDIGLLISNAGFGMKGPHETNDPDTMNRMLAINCVAPMQLCRRLIPQLKKRGRGGIIITSSVESLMGFPYSAPYAASKAFATSLAEGLWGELSPSGIDVLALCPSSTDTETLDLQGVDKSKLEGMMSPAEVAWEAL